MLSSPKLSIHSELEIFHAAARWLDSDESIKSKFAKNLFLTIRFPLLSNSVTESLLVEKSSAFHKDKECFELIIEVLQNKDKFYRSRSRKYYTNRYCTSNVFGTFFLSNSRRKDGEVEINVYQSEADSFNNLQTFLKKSRRKTICNATCLNGELYYFYYGALGFKKRFFEKFSPTFNSVQRLKGHYHYDIFEFCLCSFVDSIFFIGGFNRSLVSSRFCFEYSVINKRWRAVAKMKLARENAACAVYEGKVVVSGGINNQTDRFGTNAVEAFDHVANEWTLMPGMIEGRSQHDLIAVSNKLFAVGGNRNTCEVYDSFCEKFVFLKQIPSKFNVGLNISCKAVAIGRNLMIFKGCSSRVIVYNLDKDEWVEDSCKVVENRKGFVYLQNS